VKEIYKVIPSLIVWTLWRRRNLRKHGGDTSIQGMIYQVLQNIQFMIKKKYSWSNVTGKNWEVMLRRASTYKPRLYHFIVR